MDLLTLVAWITVIGCVSCYAHLAITKRVRLYHWSNVIGGVLLSWYNFVEGAYPNLVIEIPYTFIAAYALFRLRGQSESVQPSV